MNPIVTLAGNVAKAPEMRFTGTGKAVVSVTVVTKDSRKDEGGQWSDHDETWYQVTCWERLAENVVEVDLQPGDPVIVVGKLRNRKWETTEGETRYTLEVTANEFAVSLKRHPVTVTRPDRSASSGGDDAWAQQPSNSNQRPMVPASQPDQPPF